MKRNIRLISLLMTVFMVLSMLQTAISASAVTSAAPTQDPTSIDRVIVNMRDAESFAEKMNIYQHTPTEVEPDPYTGGKISFNDDLQAMELEYAENKRQPDWRAMLRFNKKDTITAEYKYLVVVYNVKTTGTYKMTLWNSPGAGPEIVIADGGKDTNGFVVSAPFDISKTNDAGSIQARWMVTNMNTLGIESEDKELKFYVKEFGFFKSEADAKSYYANVDINKYPPELDEEALEEANLPDPVVMKFDKTILMLQNGFGYFTNGTDVDTHNYTAMTVDGNTCIKLNYDPNEKWEAYRTMPQFTMPNMVTEQHKYMRIVYMTTDTTANKITLRNNAGKGNVVLADNTAVSRGEWVVSDAIDISEGILQRYIDAKHCTLQFTSTNPDSEIYIKEIAFFCSLTQAGKYYGDVVTAHQALTFGDAGNSGFYGNGATDNYGVWEVNNIDATVDIKYAESTNMKTNFCAKVRFDDSELRTEYKYARVYYRASIPSGQNNISMKLYNDGGGDMAIFSSTVADTNGDYKLTKTVELSEGMVARLQKPMHASLYLDCTDPYAVFSIKAIYFFPTKAAANSFDPVQKLSEVTVCGNSITDYRIVVSEEAGDQVYVAASAIAGRIKTLTNVYLDIVTDAEAPTAKEILIGNTNRKISSEIYDSLESYDKYAAKVSGGTIAINAYLPANLSAAVNDYMRNYFYLGLDNPEKIELDENSALSGSTSNMKVYPEWNQDDENVSNPTVFTDSFDTDSGYFTEENNTQNWTVENGVYSTDAKGFALSYIHVYEADAELGMRMKYTKADKDANFGLMLRYVGEDGYIKAGYDFDLGEWYIDQREGNDFYRIRKASAKADIKADTWYDVVFNVDGKTATLTVDGKVAVSASDIDLTSAGRVGVYAENAAVTVDDANLVLLSGTGTIWQNVTHMKIDQGKYMEGGSAWVLNDGTVLFEHSNVAYKSTDNGFTWAQTDKHMGVAGYPTIYRLNDGSFLRTANKQNKWIIVEISTDDGKTWTEQGTITNRYWQLDGKDTTAGAGNMNDKMFQSPTTGRIFYSQNYESQAGPVEGRTVFCEFFYSDDNGKTWTKSDTDSWELPGNETQTHFGECKMMECADGTIRIYNSWNPTGNIQYTESTDNGVTWGPLTPLEGFNCTQSSMQWVRDPYAENDTTYYMVWINNEKIKGYASSAPRSRLSLAKTTDGKNWEVMGDVWCWETNWLAPNCLALINQIVDPFIQVTETTIIVGSGISEQIALASASDNTYHQAQREHIWCIDKAANQPAEQLYDFKDVDTKDSFYEAVKYAVDNGLFNGTSTTTFEPYTTMNRAMFVTVLGRLEGAQVDNNTATEFTDVKVGEWYTGSVAWAAKNGIVNGMGNGIYGVTNTITVEQACTILYRYASGKSVGDSALDGKSTADFTDYASVSDWAKDGVNWAVENGIYEGSGSKLSPSAPASRWLVATMFANYVKAFS